MEYIQWAETKNESTTEPIKVLTIKPNWIGRIMNRIRKVFGTRQPKIYFASEEIRDQFIESMRPLYEEYVRQSKLEKDSST